MLKRILGTLAASIVFVVGCGDKVAPAQPAPAAYPTPSVVPVVTSAEPTRKYYGAGWIIHGSRLFVDSIATLETGDSVIVLYVEENTVEGSFLGVTLPAGTAPGPYTPCVQTRFGKGCGSFVVTVN